MNASNSGYVAKVFKLPEQKSETIFLYFVKYSPHRRILQIEIESLSEIILLLFGGGGGAVGLSKNINKIGSELWVK